MAAENIDLGIIPETNEFDREYAGKGSFRNSGSLNNGCSTNSDRRRTSMGLYRAGDYSTRNSSGNLDSSNNSQHGFPHYLRASTGSCHDFCNYGRKHAFEEKARHPFLKRMTKAESIKQNPVKTTVPAEINKVLALVVASHGFGVDWRVWVMKEFELAETCQMMFIVRTSKRHLEVMFAK
ncbi:unnamed protein product [Fraxinus pennsylvanica]|uniref:Uncharacterized protein n=1 Tax=Fraxinus pennsylvanica TaxID=56036 RepID=A0AAD2DVD2_9LAMI|nr:unnamed protein product [Fraxinus pennsylvanica]